MDIIDYSNFDTLIETYPTLQAFTTAVSLGTTMTSLDSGFKSFLCGAIYDNFYDDQIAYDSSSKFIKRLNNTITEKFDYLQKKYFSLKTLYAQLGEINQSSKMTSSSNGEVIGGSTNTQKSASTPTGISNSQTKSEMDIEISKAGGVVSVDITPDSPTDKYTNYIGNSVTGTQSKEDRQSTIERQGSTEELIKNIERLNQSLINEICKLVSKHFIILY